MKVKDGARTNAVVRTEPKGTLQLFWLLQTEPKFCRISWKCLGLKDNAVAIGTVFFTVTDLINCTSGLTDLQGRSE